MKPRIYKCGDVWLCDDGIEQYRGASAHLALMAWWNEINL